MHTTQHHPHPWLVSVVCLVTLLLGSLTLLHRAQARTTIPEAAAAPSAKAAPLRMIAKPSPHKRAMASRKIDTVVIHYMSGINIDKARWDDPALSMKILRDYRVSAHYIIDRQGTAYQLVKEKDVAWHAGGSIMPAPDNRRNVNSFSIGIELIATHDSGFTDAQYASLTRLVTDIKGRHAITRLVGHDEIAGKRAVNLGLRRDVKPDPGPKFDWSRFRGMLDNM